MDPKLKNALSVLIVEDCRPDADLAIRQLRRDGFRVVADVVETRAAFLESIRTNRYDVVLADYQLPGWTGVETLELLKQQKLEIPVILVTGAAGDEVAAECMRRGVADYVLKSRLVRLPQAVRTALEEEALRVDRARAEEALKASEMRYRRLFETAQNGIVILDAVSGRILDINPAALAMLETTPDRVLAKGLWELEAFGRAGVRPMAIHGLLEAQVSLLPESGKRMDVEITAVTCHFGDKPVLQCSLRDITLRRQAEREAKALSDLLESRVTERTQELATLNEELALEIAGRKADQEALERLQRQTTLILDSAGEAIFRSGADRQCTFANPAATRLMGYSGDELLGRNLHLVFQHRLTDGTPCSPENCQVQKALIEGTVQTARNQIFTRKDGAPIWVDMVAAPILEAGKPLGAVVIAHDVTERRRLEDRLRLRKSELERANQQMESFTRSVSHDLQTPLRHIDALSKMLIEEYGKGLEPKAQGYLAGVRTATNRSKQLISDLLRLAGVSRAELSRQRVEMNSLVNEVLNDLSRDLADRQINWRVGDLPSVECDPGLMKQVFGNLLANAVKFTRGRESAVIEVGCESTAGAPVLFVRDDGPGFSMKYSKNLFGVFKRLPGAEAYEGTGVGLAIVQSIVQRHDGRIWAESEEGKGATFYFTVGQRRPRDTEVPHTI